MVHIQKSDNALQRKQFLMRALDHKNIDIEEYKKEMKILDKEISDNLAIQLEKCRKEMQQNVQDNKYLVRTDGDYKRTVAKIIRKYLEPLLTPQEIKGVFRQGYKIMRLEC